MPLYTFKCDCGHEFDEHISIDSIINHPTYMCKMCGMDAYRIYNSVGKGISRPKGWSLPPDAPGYFDLPKEESERFVKEWSRNNLREEEP